MNLLSQQLRKKRMEKGLQAKDMAHALKIQPSKYSRIESGKTKVSLDMAKKIAETLKTPLNELTENTNGNYEIKNGNNSPLNLAAENSTLILQNEKLVDTVLKLVEQVSKNNEQQILIMQNQNDLFKEFIKLKKAI